MMATSADELVQRCRRSARFWHAWLERGTATAAEAKAVFTDSVLCARLASPLRHFQEEPTTAVATTATFGAPPAATADEGPLPKRAAEAAKRAAGELGVPLPVAEALVRLYADDQLSGLPTLYHPSANVFDLLDWGPSVAGDLGRLLHSEKCEALQVLACVLRQAHDDSHPCAPHCRELAQRLLLDGLSNELWQAYTVVSSCPSFSAAPEHGEVLACVRQGLDLQLCVLECFVFAHYDPELHTPSPEQLCRMADVFLRQRFLGSLPQAARKHAWLYGDAEVCIHAQCVGDLCLTLLIEGFALDDFTQPGTYRPEQHILLRSADCMTHLHKLFTSEWLNVCQLAVGHHGGQGPVASQDVVHCGRAAAVVVLGWAALIAFLQPAYQDSRGLGFERLAKSAVFKSPHLLVDAVRDIVGRGFLVRDAACRHHTAVRAVLRSLVAGVAQSFRLDAAVPGVHVAVSDLAEAVYAGDSVAAERVWTLDYPGQQGCFFVLQSWLLKFPSDFDSFLRLVGALAGGPWGSDDAPEAAPALYALQLLQAPLRSQLLPFHVVQHVAELTALPLRSSGSGGLGVEERARVVLREPVYVEELVLRAQGLVLPEWHVPPCRVLRPGAEGALLDGAAGGGAHWVRWELPAGEGLPALRVAMACWDSILERLDWTHKAGYSPPLPEAPGAQQVLFSILSCFSRLLVAHPRAAYAALSEVLPVEEACPGGTGLLARLLASVAVCAECRGGAAAELLPMLLRALGACCGAGAGTASGAAAAEGGATALPPQVALLQLLDGKSVTRFKVGGVGTLVAIFAKLVDRERETGLYPATLAALDLCGCLLEACSAELMVLPWAALAALPAVEGAAVAAAAGGPPEPPAGALPAAGAAGAAAAARPSPGTAAPDLDTMGQLLDFVFGACFARCHFWPCRTASDRWQLCLGCIRVAQALLPALECFNWPAPLSVPEQQAPAPWAATVAAAAAAAPGPEEPVGARLARLLQTLRGLQLRILRSWSESAFVPALLHCIYSDIAFSQAEEASEQQFLGFRSVALEDVACTHTGVPELGNVWTGSTPASGAQLLVGAMRCLHGVLSLALHPHGFAPEYAPLVQHLFEVTAARERRAPAPPRAAGDGSPPPVPHRANLVQSLYAHLCVDDAQVAEWAANSLTAICALWHLRTVQCSSLKLTQVASTPSSKLSLLAFLSVPDGGRPALSGEAAGGWAQEPNAATAAAARPLSLAPHLAKHLLQLVADAGQTVALRCACADLCRAALEAAPGLFLEEAAPLLPDCIAACGRALASFLPEAGAALDAGGGAPRRATEATICPGSGRLLLVVLHFLDGLAAAKEAALTKHFSEPVKGPGQTFPTMWDAIASVVADLLRPWAHEGRVPWPSDPEGNDEAEMSLATAAAFRLAERGCAVEALEAGARAALLPLLASLLKLDDAGLWMPQVPAAAADDAAAAARQRRERPAAADDAEMLRHPFGAPPRAASLPAATVAGAGSARPDVFQACRASADRLHGLLAKQHLRLEVLSPSSGAQGSLDDAAGHLAPATAGRCSVPAFFRCWSQLCEIACGAALETAVPSEGRMPLRHTLQLEKLGTFGTCHGIAQAHAGAASVDTFAVRAPLQLVQRHSVRLVVASLAAERGRDPQALQDLGHLLAACESHSAARVGISARRVALEAFDDLVRVVARQVHVSKHADFASRLHDSLVALLPGVVRQLSCFLQHLDMLAEHSPFFARMISFMTHLIGTPPNTAGILHASQVLAPLAPPTTASALKLREVPVAKDLLQRETALGLALVRQLTSALQVCSVRQRHRPGIPPRTRDLFAGSSYASGHSEVVLAALKLLLLLVPALRRPPKAAEEPAADASCEPDAAGGGAPGRHALETSAVLVDLLQVLAELLECAARGEEGARPPAPEASPPPQGRGQLAKYPPGSAVPAPVPEQVHEGEAQVKALDHFVSSGLQGVVLTLVERVVTALCQRGRNGHLEAHAVTTIQRSLLPQLLSCSCAVFSPSLDHQRLTLTAPGSWWSGSLNFGVWSRAVEAAWGCRLDAVLSVLLAIAQSADGAVLIAEHRAFLLLAYCPLLHAAVLPASQGLQFPAAYAWPATNDAAGAWPASGSGAPWRRPLHASWCRALLLAATTLSAAPQLAGECRVFLEAFMPRLRYVFRSGLQSGHVAILEEAAVACRLLALMSHRCSLAETLLVEAATQAFVFVVGTCLSERSSPSEVFVPVTAVERLAAQLPSDSEASPALVPSIYHQRVEYLALELHRNLLVALLSVAASPTWLSNPGTGAAVAPAAAPGAWPNTPSALGLRPLAGGGLGMPDGSASPLRLWAAVMDATLEGARRVVEILEALQDPGRSSLLLVAESAGAAAGGGAGGGALVPLSFGLAPLEPQSEAEAQEPGRPGGPQASPGGLARGLAPPSQQGLGGLSPIRSPLGRSRTRRPAGSPPHGTVYKHLALQAQSTVGGQVALGLVPEYVTFEDLRALCGSILEMSCTLLCHFCQAMRSSIFSGGEWSAPGASVLSGLLNFLHEAPLRSLGLDAASVDYVAELDAALRSWQHLGAPEGEERHRMGEAWAAGTE